MKQPDARRKPARSPVRPNLAHLIAIVVIGLGIAVVARDCAARAGAEPCSYCPVAPAATGAATGPRVLRLLVVERPDTHGAFVTWTGDPSLCGASEPLQALCNAVAALLPPAGGGEGEHE